MAVIREAKEKLARLKEFQEVSNGLMNMRVTTESEQNEDLVPDEIQNLRNQLETLTVTASSQETSNEVLQRQLTQLTQRLVRLIIYPPRINDADTSTDQLHPMQGQQENRAGGFSHVVTDMMKLKRYIALGDEKLFYHACSNENVDAQEDGENCVSNQFSDEIECVTKLIQGGKGKEVIDTITKYSLEGRAPREDKILAILRDCVMYEGKARYDDQTTLRRAAYDRVKTVCNIPTKLFRFLQLCEQRQNSEKRPCKRKAENEEDASRKKKKKSSGWGRGKRRGIRAFYTDRKKSADRLLLLLTKYKCRHNWSHRQVLGYSHPKIESTDEEKEAKDIAFTYVTRGFKKLKDIIQKKEIQIDGAGAQQTTVSVFHHIEILEKIKKLKPSEPGDVQKLVGYINKYGVRDDAASYTTVYATPGSCNVPEENKDKKKVPFQIVREHIPTGFLKHMIVWEALLKDMPMTALIRNLGKMTSLRIFDQEENVKVVEQKLSDMKYLNATRIHPMKVLIALKVYENGKKRWHPNNRIVGALEKAFYSTFKVCHEDGEPGEKHAFATGKKFMLALDVSDSMTWGGLCGCELLTPSVVSVALALVTLNIEKDCSLFGFGGNLHNLRDLLRRDMKLNEAMNAIKALNFGATDCSLPMLHAIECEMDVDVFIIYTDSDTWYGKMHPSEALVEYRTKMNKPDAKLLVLAMQSSHLTIADGNDPFMMDICGFDCNVPDLIYQFAKGDLLDG